MAERGGGSKFGNYIKEAALVFLHKRRAVLGWDSPGKDLYSFGLTKMSMDGTFSSAKCCPMKCLFGVFTALRQG